MITAPIGHLLRVRKSTEVCEPCHWDHLRRVATTKLTLCSHPYLGFTIAVPNPDTSHSVMDLQSAKEQRSRQIQQRMNTTHGHQN